MEGRLYKTRSLSAAAVTGRGRASSVDPLAGISRGRDDDFRKTMVDKVSRAQRALSVRPDVGGDYPSHRRHRSVSVGRTTLFPASSAVYLPVRTPQSAGLVLAGSGSLEYWPATVSDPGKSAVRYGSVQPEMLRKRVDVDKILLPPAVTISRKVIDDGDDLIGRQNRIGVLLEQLRRVNGPQLQSSLGDSSTRAAYRAEVDSFAAALNKVSVPTLTSDLLGRRRTLGSESANDDTFWSRLCRSRGDLERVEGLAIKTFNWNEKPTRWSTTVDTNTPDTASSRIVESKTTTEEPREIFTFFTDRNINIRGTNTTAEQAVRWAQQRRVEMENDLEKERQRERYGLHNLPKSGAMYGILTSQPATKSTSAVVEDDYLTDDEYFAPHYVPTVVRPWSSTVTRSTVDIAKASDFDKTTRPTRSYTRSISDLTNSYKQSTTEQQQKRQERKLKEPASEPTESSTASEISDVRRKVRAVLNKSRGLPVYD